MSMPDERKRGRLARLILLFALLILAVYLFTKRGVLEEYWLYFTEQRMPMALDLATLSGDWDEDSLYRRFQGFPIYCRTY